VGSIGNGIRFDRQGRMFIADFKKHNVWVIERGETTPQVYFHSDRFNQPNDLAIAADGTLYASDPQFAAPAGGQIWRITRGADGTGRGEVMSSTRHLGVTNGIDLSPDGATLYVSESNSRQVWAYRLDGSKLLDPRLVRGFADFEVDGLRTDRDGRIYLARLSAGKIAIIGADGSLQREVPLSGKQPTNVTFGGPDGRTVFVTQKEGRFIEAFRVDRPGREPCLQVPGMC
jgi:signal peptidase